MQAGIPSRSGAQRPPAARRFGVLARAGAFAGDYAFRLERKAAKRFNDVELRQLKSLERAYRGSSGPELLVFGDSAMFWTTHRDGDRRHLVQMIRDELGGGVGFEALVGPGYNPRIIMAFLSALEGCRARPRVVIVPTSILFAMSTWLAHPVLGYELVAGELRAAIAANGDRPRRLPRPGQEAEDAFDRRPASSLIGARRTVGELRLITNAPPDTRWQQVVRLRHLMDFYNAERLEPDSPGVLLVGELGRMLSAMGLRSVAYVAPINYEVVSKTLGEGARDHLARNADLVETAYREAAGAFGTVVNAVFECPAGEFMDPLHLSEVGRGRLARVIAAAVAPMLEEDGA
jgi:hypothetical protein